MILLGLAFTTTLPVMADSDTPAPGSGDAILTTEENDPLIKRMPSRMLLHLTYEDGMISISSEYYEGAFYLIFENYETGGVYEVPSIMIGQSVPLLLKTGEYQLTAVGEDGIVLKGFLQVY